MKFWLKRFSKYLLYFLLIILILIGVGYFWPMPELASSSNSGPLLIRQINIVDVENGIILKDRDVLIKDNIIVAIDSAGVLKKEDNIQEISGRGKFLMPGLWDMHTHSTKLSPWIHHPLYVAYGVTGIRDMSGHLGQDDSYWAGTTDRLKWNKELEDVGIIRPRYLLQSSYQINGANSVPSGYLEFFKAETSDHVTKLLEHYRQEGADFVKVYSDIDSKAFLEMAEKADTYELYLAGHKPMGLRLEQAIKAGQRSFEHGRIFMFDCYPGATALRESNNRAKTYVNSKIDLLTKNDTACAANLMELMSERQTYWTPTLSTLKSAYRANDPEFVNTERLKYIPSLQRKLWWNPDISRAAAYNQADSTSGVNSGLYRLAQRHILMAHERGVPIMLGTDVTDSYVFPGLTVHDELKDLVEAGLSPLDALRSATIVSARFSEVDDILGSVAVGKVADLLILSANPLEDIANSNSMAGVILNGNYLDPDTLAALRANTSDLTQSFHLNIKYAFGLFGSPLIRKQFAD